MRGPEISRVAYDLGHLRTAHNTFTTLGMEAFAGRAPSEQLAKAGRCDGARSRRKRNATLPQCAPLPRVRKSTSVLVASRECTHGASSLLTSPLGLGEELPHECFNALSDVVPDGSHGRESLSGGV